MNQKDPSSPALKDVYRLFVAIALSDEWRSLLCSVSSGTPKFSDIRWIPAQNLHVTTCFIGEVPRDAAQEISSRLGSELSGTKAFDLRFEKICLAPNEKHPRMIWAKFQEEKSFSELVASLSAILGNWIDPKTRHEKAIAHVTLARLRSPWKIKNVVFPNCCEAGRILPVKGCELWESTLHPSGAVYRSLERYEFCEAKVREMQG